MEKHIDFKNSRTKIVDQNSRPEIVEQNMEP